MTQTNAISLKQYKAVLTNDHTGSSLKPKKNKYKAVLTTVDGFRFHSKKEAEYYKKLKLQQSNGEIARFHPQCTFLLPGGIRHHVDFIVIHNDLYGFEWIEYIEVKGIDTPIGKLKRKQCEEIYKIEIKVV